MISKMSSGSFDPQPLPPPPNMDALQKKALTSADSDTPGSSSDGSDGLTFSSTQPSAAHEPTSQPQQSSPPQPQQSTPQTGLFKGRFGIA
ncbi:hypothetical protein BASA81_012982 [Batrachochytrium salamandrivorans]|nr:hypothetical protein BASA81_012982 [Batrachochytrium salamandrivorans]